MSEYPADVNGNPVQNSQMPTQAAANQQVPAEAPAGGQAAPQNQAPQGAAQNQAPQGAAQNQAPQGAAQRPPAAPAGQEVIGAGTPQPQGDNTLQRNPDEWATGDEPMTEAQKSYLDTLARENGEQLPANLTKAEASKQIDRLQKGSPRTQQ